MGIRPAYILSVFSLFTAFFLGGCAAVLKEERSFSRSGLTVAFRSLNYLDDTQNIKFIYPVILSEENVRNHLLSLYHQDIVSPRKPRPVFSRASAAKLAPLFRTAMKKVKPGKYLHFQYQAPGGITEGQVFAAPGKLYWHFFKINGVAHSNDPLRIQKPTWKLVRMRGQAYQRLQTGGFKKTIKNRVIADLNLPYPRQRGLSLPKTKAPRRK